MLCDELPAIGATSYDFHKHLCENHFRERLLSVIQQVEIKEGDTTIKKWQCPVPNCGYQLPQKWVMAKHYGLKHQVAKQMYAKICDISALPPDVLQAQLRHTATANAVRRPARAGDHRRWPTATDGDRRRRLTVDGGRRPATANCGRGPAAGG